MTTINVLTYRTAGNDREMILAALAAAQDELVVILPGGGGSGADGAYELDAAVAYVGTPKIVGLGRTIIRQTGENHVALDITAGALGPAATALTANAARAATTLTVASTAAFEADCWARIWNNVPTPMHDGLVEGQTVRVKSVDSATQLTLYTRLEQPFTTATATVVRRVNPGAGVLIEGIAFEKAAAVTGEGTTPASNFIEIRIALAPHVQHCTFTRGDAAAVSIRDSIFWRAIDLDFINLPDGPSEDPPTNRDGYGVYERGWCLGGLMSGCRMVGGRHMYTTGATAGQAWGPRDTQIVDCLAIGLTRDAFDTHAAGRGLHFINCIARQSFSGFHAETPDCVFTNCWAIDCGFGFWLRAERADGGIIRGGGVVRTGPLSNVANNGIRVGCNATLDGVSVDTTGWSSLFLNPSSPVTVHVRNCVFKSPLGGNSTYGNTRNCITAQGPTTLHLSNVELENAQVGIWTSADAITLAPHGVIYRSVSTPIVAGNNTTIAPPAMDVNLRRLAVGNFSETGASHGKSCAGTSYILNSSRSGTSTSAHHSFYNPNGLVGTITTNGVTTSFNTSSDENWKLFKGELSPEDAIAIIRADPVRRWNWKPEHGGSEAIGWGAQTSYAASPDLATPGGWFVDTDNGEVEVDNTTPEAFYRPWGVDQSKRAPYLWAALAGAWDRLDAQDAIIADLTARIAALDGGAE